MRWSNLRPLRHCVWLMALAGSASTLAAESTLAPHVDKRVELLGIVYRLARLPEFLAAPPTQYTADVDKYFARYAHHALIAYVSTLSESLRASGADIGAWEVQSLAVHLRQPPALEPLVALNDASAADGWDNRSLLTPLLLKLLQQFYRDAHCERFFRSQQVYYDAVDQAYAKQTVAVTKEWFTRFFALSPTETYRAIFSVMGVGDYGYIRVNYGNNLRDTYTIFAGTPATGNSEKMGRLNLHEYIHAFSNQLVDRHILELRTSAEKLLAEPIVATRVKDTFFNNAPFLLYESLVRAISIKYLSDNKVFGANRDHEIEAQEKAGFLWIRGLVDQLDNYERGREKYHNFDEFMPRLVEYFANAADSSAALTRLSTTVPPIRWASTSLN